MYSNRPLYTSERIAVPAEFADIFSHFYVAENNTGHSIHKTLLPTFQTIMVFNFGPGISFATQQDTRIELEKCLVIGPVKQPIDYTLPVGAQMLVANFKGDAFYRFFGQVLLSAGMHVHPDELVDENCFTELWYTLYHLPSSNERVAYILEFCRPYLTQQDLVMEKITGFTDTNSSSIKSVAQKTRLSERSIQLKHKQYLGYSAKELSRYQRFLKAIQLVENTVTKAKPVDWQEIITVCGYYDQSQLIHDFKHFLNLSPTQYITFQQDICIAATP